MKPHANLEPYAQERNGIFYFDSSLGQETIVLIHGNGDEADTWRHVFVPLAKHFRVIALDLPGFGRSQSNISSIAGFTTTILELLETLNLKAVHLIGSSLGAVVSANFAAAHKTRAKTLCLIGGAAPNLGGLEISTTIQPLLSEGIGEAYYNSLREAGQEAAFATLNPYYANLSAMPSADLEFLGTRVWERVHSDTQRDAFFAALRSLFTPAERLELNLPTLLIWGEADTIIPQIHAQKLLQEIQKSRLNIIAKAGHLPHQEQPEATLGVLLEWMIWVVD
jgi:pimeloyl-ACP methyl ester carboxylesterase